MTLNDYINMTDTTCGTKNFIIYRMESEDEFWDRYYDRGELKANEEDEFCLCAFNNIQPLIIRSFLKNGLANATVIRQVISKKRIYVFVDLEEK